MVQSGPSSDGRRHGVSDARNFLVVSHTGRSSALEATADVCGQLAAAGAVPVVAAEQWHDVMTALPELEGVVKRFEEVSPKHIELVIVLGGDGTILRAAELTRDHPVPLLGVNLGHVGFLAESERDDLGYTVGRALARDYTVEERMTLSVRAKVGEEVVYEGWALNEATVEKAERERMLEVVIEVDRRPLSSFGCDGVVMSTPTGSTAYSFSAGGPVVWPAVEALLLVPLSAHALFARPLVVGPDSSLAVEVLQRAEATAVIWCDGRRMFELPPGARVIVRRSPVPVRLARLHQAPFTDRLVNKFQLPVTGWRGPVAGD
ncbi:NAD kinase [Agromyces binzhouensis]|uniref:NAD kinase n=1 Tax=Agromyces binzhouensis TaxID=1817495 RepID=A0A4Q2JHK9_9MICO|nr:NAD kinase [Agromyces binzhouensis]